MKLELLKSRAYPIFWKELATDLDVARLRFFNGDVLNEKILHESGVTFHKIKGAAGFMGLRELAACAAELERIFKKSTEEAVCEMDKARQLIAQLEEIFSGLPRPEISDMESGK